MQGRFICLRRVIFAFLALVIIASITAPAVASTCPPCTSDDYGCELYKCLSPRCSTVGNCAAGVCQSAVIQTDAIWERAHLFVLHPARISPVNERSLAPPKPPPQRMLG